MMDEEENLTAPGPEVTAETAEAEEINLRRQWKKIPDAAYEVAREKYETGLADMVEIAMELGVSRQAVHSRFKKDGVVKGSKIAAIKTAAAEAVAKAAIEATVVTESYASRREAWIEETRVNGYTALKQTQLMARKIVADQVRSGGALAAIDDNLKTVQRLSKILTENIDAQLKLLNAGTDTGKGAPKLLIEDLTDEEVLEHHIMTGALPEDATLADLLKDEDGEF